jgi:hypothetical protein
MAKILGIRNSTTVIRYAILEGDNNHQDFLNRETENKIDIPRRIVNDSEKLAWVYREYDRIINQNGPFDSLVIKQNENTRAAFSAVKFTAYLDGLTHLIAGQKNLPITCFIYNQLGTNSREVEVFAEDKFG